MSFKKHKELVLEFYEEVWGLGNVEFAKKIFDENYIRHDLRSGHALAGAAGQMQIAGDFRKAFPDLQIAIDLIFGDDEYVAARWTMSGTHAAAWGNHEATNKTVNFSGVNIFRFENGKVMEIWNHRDDLGLYQQLGVPVSADTNQ